MRGFYCLLTTFDTIVGVREPNFGDVCLSLCVPEEDDDIFVHLGLFAFLWGVKSKK